MASHYPAVSHTFVSREVRALRRLGIDVRTFSIRRTPPGQLLSDADREAEQTTFSVLPTTPLALARAHSRALLTRPGPYLRTLAFALRRAVPGVRGRLWGLFYFAEAMVVWDEARRAGVRHLHAQFADAATDVALLVARFGGPGWTWSLAVHGPVEFSDVHRNHLAEKVADARFTVAISHFGRSQLMSQVGEEHWERIHVVRCGIEPALYLAGGGTDAATILCVGRLVHLKGQSMLVEAVAELAARGVEASLVLVGDGPKRAQLEELARRLGVEDRVTFTGSLAPDEVAVRLGQATVFCLPSMAEGLPVVLMEAMAVELPVIGTRITGVPELVQDGVTGLLVTPGRQDELVDALQRLLGDPELRGRLGRAGRRRVLAEFDVDRSARRLQELFAETLGAPGAASAPSALEHA